MTTIDQLEARLRLHDDERAIVRLLSRYAHAMYDGHVEDFVACWAEDAVFEHVRHGQVYVGHERLREFFHGVSHAPAAFHKHVVIEPIIEIEGDEARCVSEFLFVQDRGGPYISHFGRYLDRFARGDDGSWRFTSRRVFTEAAATGPGVSASAHAPDVPAGVTPHTVHPGRDD
jgi:ketosteroid isomerase-like protein